MDDKTMVEKLRIWRTLPSKESYALIQEAGERIEELSAEMANVDDLPNPGSKTRMADTDLPWMLGCGWLTIAISIAFAVVVLVWRHR